MTNNGSGRSIDTLFLLKAFGLRTFFSDCTKIMIIVVYKYCMWINRVKLFHIKNDKQRINAMMVMVKIEP